MEYTSKAQLVSQMKLNLETRKDVRVRALLRIFENQTYDEQRTESTNRYNGIGFTGSDARFLSSLAKQYKYKKEFLISLYHTHIVCVFVRSIEPESCVVI